MTTNEIRKIRCEEVLSKFMASGRGCVFFTLTTKDVVDLKEIRERWRNLRHWLARRLGYDAKYVMNYEVHPKGHGWHIHSVWNHYIDLRRFLPKIQSFGFGRVDVRKVDSKGVSEYLTKHALKAYAKRVKLEGGCARCRLVNASRGLPVLSDYHYESEFGTLRKQVFRQVNRLCVPFAVKSAISNLAADLGGSVTTAVCVYYGFTDGFTYSHLKINK